MSPCARDFYLAGIPFEYSGTLFMNFMIKSLTYQKKD